MDHYGLVVRLVSLASQFVRGLHDFVQSPLTDGKGRTEAPTNPR